MTQPQNKNSLVLIVIILFTIQCIFFIVLLFQIRAVNQKIFNTNRLVIEKLINNEQEELKIDVNPSDIVIGDKDAPLTLFMFSNYTCSVCKAFFNETYPEIESQFIKTGKVKFVLKLIAPRKTLDANFISRSVICAFQQDKFVELHNYLNQADILPDSGQIAGYISKQLTLDMKSYETCINDKDLDNYITDNNKFFKKHRIKGTPAFIINDSLFLGNKSYNKFEELINRELNKIKN